MSLAAYLSETNNYNDLDKTQVKLFPNFTSIPFPC